MNLNGDNVLIKINGSSELVLENYKGILEYGDNQMKIKAKPNNIILQGNGLEIKTITDEILYIIGNIEKIIYAEE